MQSVSQEYLGVTGGSTTIALGDKAIAYQYDTKFMFKNITFDATAASEFEYIIRADGYGFYGN